MKALLKNLNFHLSVYPSMFSSANQGAVVTSGKILTAMMKIKHSPAQIRQPALVSMELRSCELSYTIIITRNIFPSRHFFFW